MKLNLVEDFQTGIYDYNELTSSFVTLSAGNGRPEGTLSKCGAKALISPQAAKQQPNENVLNASWRRA